MQKMYTIWRHSVVKVLFKYWVVLWQLRFTPRRYRFYKALCRVAWSAWGIVVGAVGLSPGLTTHLLWGLIPGSVWCMTHSPCSINIYSSDYCSGKDIFNDDDSVNLKFPIKMERRKAAQNSPMLPSLLRINPQILPWNYPTNLPSFLSEPLSYLLPHHSAPVTGSSTGMPGTSHLSCYSLPGMLLP